MHAESLRSRSSKRGRPKNENTQMLVCRGGCWRLCGAAVSMWHPQACMHAGGAEEGLHRRAQCADSAVLLAGAQAGVPAGRVPGARNKKRFVRFVPRSPLPFREPVCVARNEPSASQQGAVQHVWAIMFNCRARHLEKLDRKVPNCSSSMYWSMIPPSTVCAYRDRSSGSRC